MAKRGNKKEDKSNENKNPQNRTQVLIQIITTIGLIVVALIGILPSLLRNAQEPPSPTVIPTNTIVIPTAIVLTDTPIPPTATQFTATPTLAGYYEDFNQGTNWISIETPASNEYGTEARYIADGIFHWNVQAFKNSTFSTTIRDLKNPNFEFEVVFQKVETSNPEDDYYGIRFRKNSGFSYTFYISNKGTYGLDKYSYEEEKWEPPVAETQYPAINQNGNNTLKVVGQGESIHLFINGILLERILDKSSLAGSFSLWSWLPYPEHSMKMEISHLSIVPLSSSSPLDIWPTLLTDVQTAELQLYDVDDEMTVWVNGQEVVTAKYRDAPAWIQFGNYLKSGDNLLEVSIRNGEAGQDCSGQLRLKLNGIVNSAYQWFWDNKDAPANTECFNETVVLTLK